MVYKTGIPVGSTKPKNTYTDIAENFTQLNNQYGTTGDHVEFTASSNNGKHKKSTYLSQGTTDQNTGSTDVAVYAKTISGSTELYYRQPSNGSVVQWTRGTPSIGNPSYTFLPGGFKMQFGSVTANSSGVTVPLAFSSAVYSITATCFNTDSSANVTVENVSIASCKLYSSKTNLVYYVAIGY